MARFLTLLAVLGITLRAYGTPQAAPAANPNDCQNYDDLPENPGGFDPTVDPVGTYHYIYYQGFVVATQKNAADKFFHIPSPPNILNSNSISQDLYGGTSALQLNTTAIFNSRATFTITSMRLACLVTNGQSTSNAEGCTVLFVGNKRNKAMSVTYEYEYANQNTSATFGTGPLTTFGTVKFPSDFTRLAEMYISLTAVQNEVIGVNILIDNVCLTITSE